MRSAASREAPSGVPESGWSVGSSPQCLPVSRRDWPLDPGARYTNSTSGPSTSPKFGQIIPDKLCETMVAGINKPFTQNPNSSFFLEVKQFRAALQRKKYQSYPMLPTRTVSGGPTHHLGSSRPAFLSPYNIRRAGGV